MSKIIFKSKESNIEIIASLETLKFNLRPGQNVARCFPDGCRIFHEETGIDIRIHPDRPSSIKNYDLAKNLFGLALEDIFNESFYFYKVENE